MSGAPLAQLRGVREQRGPVPTRAWPQVLPSELCLGFTCSVPPDVSRKEGIAVSLGDTRWSHMAWPVLTAQAPTHFMEGS